MVQLLWLPRFAPSLGCGSSQAFLASASENTWYIQALLECYCQHLKTHHIHIYIILYRSIYNSQAEKKIVKQNQSTNKHFMRLNQGCKTTIFFSHTHTMHVCEYIISLCTVTDSMIAWNVWMENNPPKNQLQAQISFKKLCKVKSMLLITAQFILNTNLSQLSWSKWFSVYPQHLTLKREQTFNCTLRLMCKAFLLFSLLHLNSKVLPEPHNMCNCDL